MRILQVASGMPRWAGTEKYVIDISAELLRMGHEVAIGCQRNSDIEAQATKQGIPIVPLIMKSTQDWKQFPIFFRAIRGRFDVVNTHDFRDYIVPAVAARLAATPAVIMTRHLPHPFNSGFSAYLCSRVFYDRIIAVSEAVRDILTNSGVAEERVRVVINGIDSPAGLAANGAEFRAGLSLPAGAMLVAAAGRIEDKKGFDILIRAIGIARNQGVDVHAAIAGRGEDRAHLESLRDGLGLTSFIQFLGFRSDVLNVLAAADMVTVPSKWEEPLGYGVLEAMSCGTPTIASRTGGIPEIAIDGTAILVPPGDIDELARAIISLASNPAMRAELSQKGRARAMNFTVAACATGVERVYQEVLTARTNGQKSALEGRRV